MKVKTAFHRNLNPVVTGGFVVTQNIVSRMFWSKRKQTASIDYLIYYPFLEFYDIDECSVEIFNDCQKHSLVVIFKCKSTVKPIFTERLEYWVDQLEFDFFRMLNELDKKTGKLAASVDGTNVNNLYENFVEFVSDNKRNNYKL